MWRHHKGGSRGRGRVERRQRRRVPVHAWQISLTSHRRATAQARRTLSYMGRGEKRRRKAVPHYQRGGPGGMGARGVLPRGHRVRREVPSHRMRSCDIHGTLRHREGRSRIQGRGTPVGGGPSCSVHARERSPGLYQKQGVSPSPLDGVDGR